MRNAVGVAIPLVAGAMLHNVAGGLVAATGALDAAFSDSSEPYLHRARRMTPRPPSSRSPYSPDAGAAAITR